MLSSGQDNFEKLETEVLQRINPEQPILEFSVIKLFIVNLLQLIRNKVTLAKNFNISPSEIDRLYYWEYEYMLDEVNNEIKTENERNQKENDKYSGFTNPGAFMRSVKGSMPKTSVYNIPKIPSIGSL